MEGAAVIRIQGDMFNPRNLSMKNVRYVMSDLAALNSMSENESSMFSKKIVAPREIVS